jgi:hypothetical protein
MRRFGMLVVLAALAAASSAAIARADKLDNRIHEECKEKGLLKKLKDKGFKNVGILRFSVQQGEAKPAYTAPLSGSMVTRLETFMIIHGGSDEKKALGVIHDAGTVAAKQKINTWSTAADRRRMFEVSYPLA